MSSDLITKSNCLIEASYGFSLNEHRILLYGVSLINPIEKNFPDNFVIDIKRFSEIFNVDVDGLYSDIKNAIINKFFNRRFTVVLEDGKRDLCHWLEKLTYEDGSGLLRLQFSKTCIPLLQNLKSKYTTYFMHQIVNFKSVYSIRIYEFCIMHLNKHKENHHELIITLADIKQKLSLSSKYPRIYDFKTNVLNKAKQEINKHSDLTIDFEEIKKGRAVKSIKFIIERKHGAKPAKYQGEEQQELDLNTDGAEEFNTDSSPMSEEEFTQLMRKNDLKVRMFSYRVAEKVACQLIKSYSFEQIESALNYTDNLIKEGKEIKNKPAYLVNAIKEGY